jgi:hypothetical protein
MGVGQGSVKGKERVLGPGPGSRLGQGLHPGVGWDERDPNGGGQASSVGFAAPPGGVGLGNVGALPPTGRPVVDRDITLVSSVPSSFLSFIDVHLSTLAALSTPRRRVHPVLTL